MIQRSHSDDRVSWVPHNVDVLHAGLCDQLGIRRHFWLDREFNRRFRPRERFVIMCMAERMMHRFHHSWPDIAHAFRISHGTLQGAAIMRKADTLFGLYPDLARAVRRMDGYSAGQYIFDTWRTPILMVCGEQPDATE